MKRAIIILIICIILFIAYMYVSSMILPKQSYVIGFPKDKSSGRTNLLLHYGTKHQATITEKNNEDIHLARSINTQGQQQIRYETIAAEKITNHYAPIFGKRDGGEQFRDLHMSFLEEATTSDAEAHTKGYPHVTAVQSGPLTITTNTFEQTFDLSELLAAYGKTNNDFYTIHVQQASTNAIFLTLYFSDARDADVYHLFMTGDGEDVQVVHGEQAPFAEAITSGALEQYMDVLIQTTINERYKVIRGLDGIYDQDEREIIRIDEADQLSADGRFVYLNGGDGALVKGKQRIQKTEDYVEGNGKTAMTFKLHFRQMAKEFGLTTIGATDQAELIYFNGDYVMYTFSFKGFLFGSAGNMNVIVDLQEDPAKPVFYLFNFRMTSS